MSMPVLSDEAAVLVLVESAADDVTCDWDTCAKPASWSLRCQECSRVLLDCTEHREYYDNLLTDDSFTASCRGCATYYPLPLAWLPL